MAVSNKEIGQAWTVYVLGDLFDRWPRRGDFSTEELVTNTGLGPSEDPDALFDDLMIWLRDNDFLWFTQATSGCIYNAALTEKGMAILGRAPAFGKGKSIGATLKSVAVGAMTEAGRKAIGEAVDQIIGLATRAVGGS